MIEFDENDRIDETEPLLQEDEEVFEQPNRFDNRVDDESKPFWYILLDDKPFGRLMGGCLPSLDDERM